MIFLIDNKLVKKNKKSNDFNVRSLSFFVDYITFIKNKKINNKFIKTTINEINNNSFDSYTDLFDNQLFYIEDKQLKDIIKCFNELIIYSHKVSSFKYWYEKKYEPINENDLIKYVALHKELETIIKKKIGIGYSNFSKTINKYLFVPKVQ